MQENSAGSVGLAILYQWKLKPGAEKQFVEAWEQMTRLLMQHRGALGSRLHQAEDGCWVAYAQWPDKATWKQSKAQGSISEEISLQMDAAIDKAWAPLVLHTYCDRLRNS